MRPGWTALGWGPGLALLAVSACCCCGGGGGGDRADDPCGALLLDPGGAVPDGYPFSLPRDAAAEAEVRGEVTALFAAAGVGPPAELTVYPGLNTPRWDDGVLDLTPDRAVAPAEEVAAALDAFLAEHAALLNTAELERRDEPDAGRDVLYLDYRQTYCGLPVAGGWVGLEPLVEGGKPARVAWLRAEIRTDGVLVRLENHGLPHTVPLPRAPVVSAEDAGVRAVGVTMTYQCEGEQSYTVLAEDIEAVGEPVVFLLGFDDRVEWRLAWPVRVGGAPPPFTVWIDAVTGERLAMAQDFVC